MQITGIESVEFGAPDMAEARTLFSDWGLRKAAAGGAGSDAHVPDALGAAYVEMPDFDGPADFLAKRAEYADKYKAA